MPPISPTNSNSNSTQELEIVNKGRNDPKVKKALKPHERNYSKIPLISEFVKLDQLVAAGWRYNQDIMRPIL